MYHILNSETKRCTWVSESTSCRDHLRAAACFRLLPKAQPADHSIRGKKWEITRVTGRPAHLRGLQLCGKSGVVTLLAGEGLSSSVGSTRSTTCVLRWLGHHGEDELAAPPNHDCFPTAGAGVLSSCLWFLFTGRLQRVWGGLWCVCVCFLFFFFLSF